MESQTQTDRTSREVEHVAEQESGSHANRKRVAYLVSWFPKLTETFVLREMVELEKLGYQIELFPLRKGSTKILHPAAADFVARAHFTGFLSIAIVIANLIAMFRMPIRYFSTFGLLIWKNLGSQRYLTAAIVFFPKTIYIAQVIKSLEVDYVHAHFASHPAMAAYVIRRITGIQYGFTAHGSDLHRDQHMLLEKTKDAAHVIAISEYNRQMILDVCGQEFRDKVKVVHCGVETQRYPRSQWSAVTDSATDFQIACVGTLHEVKGQSYLIEACKILNDRQVGFCCHLVGDGPDRVELERQVISLGLEGKLIFHGSCDEEQVKDILSGMDVLVCPSVLARDGRREGIPVVIMEAMSCGIPCVASDISGIPEIVRHGVNGLLTPCGDSGAIADSIMQLLKDSDLRQQFSKSAVETVEAEYELSLNTASLARLLEISMAKKEIAV
ncbi:glycosyltransferase [Mariniblastus sp.]|jgi:colanic acid/amylovoran biosynthesis glycosyltransferase|nr:glycosyltransferase [Mariniblastus sp.]MDB4670835.1 glycosyltransferase [Pirellulaceae bacterium]MDB4756456.1 glycosyltransferase [Mariniblastus sp.]